MLEHEFRYRLPALAAEVFQYRGFIADNAGKIERVEIMQSLVIRNNDWGIREFPVAATFGVYLEFVGFPAGLRRDGQRC